MSQNFEVGKKQGLWQPGRGVSQAEGTGSTGAAPSVLIRWQQGRWDEAEENPGGTGKDGHRVGPAQGLSEMAAVGGFPV